jgi:hypothetical protein
MDREIKTGTPDFSAKRERRLALAALPWHEKVKILIQLQKMALPILESRNPRACVWGVQEQSPKG